MHAMHLRTTGQHCSKQISPKGLFVAGIKLEYFDFQFGNSLDAAAGMHNTMGKSFCVYEFLLSQFYPPPAILEQRQ